MNAKAMMRVNGGKEEAQTPDVKRGVKALANMDLGAKKMLGKFANSVLKIYEMQEKEGNRKAAQNSGHMLRVALNAMDYCRKNPSGIEGANKDVAERLAGVAGILHDIVRQPHEIEGRNDGIVTADLVAYMAGAPVDANQDYREEYERLAEASPEEIKCIENFLQASDGELPYFSKYISDAIKINEMSVANVVERIGEMKSKGDYAGALLQEALLYADKGIEGVGEAVVVRRAQFVSGERAENPKDVEKIKRNMGFDGINFTEGEFRILAFIGESMIRIYSDKRVEDFPENKMFAGLNEERKKEIRVYRAALCYMMKRHYRLDTEKKIYEFLKENKFPRMDPKKNREICRDIEGNMKNYNVDNMKRSEPIAEDACLLIVGLAYSQSSYLSERKKSQSFLESIDHRGLKRLAKLSKPENLKRKFESRLEQVM